MKKLIVVRHGHYDPDGNLSDIGRAQVKRLREQLSPMIGNLFGIVFTSHMPRAIKTGTRLTDNFDVLTDQALYAEGKKDVNLVGILSLIDRNADYELVILVTHKDCTSRIAEYMAGRFGINFESRALEYGEAVVIDLEKREITLITSPS